MKFIEENIENMKNDLAELVSVDSVYSEDEKPFGKNNKVVLDKALKLMDKIGLKTTNLDYYCGYGEIGNGDKKIGILAHLDIVPVGDGWDSDPLKMVEKDGFLYGRGVSDDKGAAIASLYALKYLIDSGYKLNKRVRLILGCNEESGSACIKHYVEKCGHIDAGFTPDGNFPGIYAEKGMIMGTIKGKTKIKDINGGEATNIVCKKVSCYVDQENYNYDKFAAFLNKHEVKFEVNADKITVYGVAAHASMPDDGVNAINYLMEGLYNADFNDEFVNVFHNCIGLDVHGERLGYDNLKDDVSNTSINIGMASKENDEILLSFDMRFPVKATKEMCLKPLEKINSGNVYFDLEEAINPLFFDLNNPMIKALSDAYIKVTGDTETKMMAIGGGTYAKSINNCIAFGCEFLNEDNKIHGANECLSIESFKKQVEIYIEAIKQLNEAEL